MPQTINRVLVLFERFAVFERKIILSISTMMLLLATAIMLLEGISRAFFSTSFFWAEESVRYLMLWAFFLTLGCAGHAGQHIRTDLVVNRFSPMKRRGLAVVVCVLGIIFCGLLVIASVPQIQRYYSLGMATNSSLNLPMWLLFLVLPAGSVLWAIYYCHVIARVIAGREPFVSLHGQTAKQDTNVSASSEGR